MPIQPKTSNILSKFWQKLATTLRVGGPAERLVEAGLPRGLEPRGLEPRGLPGADARLGRGERSGHDGQNLAKFYKIFANFWRARSRLYK